MGSMEAEDHKSGIKKASTPKHKSVYTEASLMPSASYYDSICLDLKWVEIRLNVLFKVMEWLIILILFTISLFLTCWELCWFPQLDIGPIHVWNPPTPLHWNVDHRQLDVHILYWNKVLMVGLVVEIFLVFWKLIINKSSQQFSDHSPLHLHLLRHRQDTNRALLNPTRGVTMSVSSPTPSPTSTRVWTWWPWGVFCTFRLVLTAFWASTSSLHWLDWDGRTDTGLICQYRHRTQTINYQISVLSYLLKFFSYLPSVTTIWTSRMVSSVNSSPARSCWLSEGGREGGRVGDREGGLDTLVVSRIKIYFGEMK